MPDAFGELRRDDPPVAPDPAFAADLRERLERALALPKGVTPVTARLEWPVVDAGPRSAAVPYLAVADARRALDWYGEVFGAELAAEPIVMPDGRIGHAELNLAGGSLYLADQHPEIGVTAPRPGESTVSLMLPVADADEVRARALAAGASGDREPYDGYGRRNAWIVDPFGHRWGLHSPLAAPAPQYRQGDIAYVSLWVPDPQRARRFYTDVLGWEFTADGRQVEGAVPVTGVTGSEGTATLFCCYAVDDVAAAVQRVRDAGGTAERPVQRPYGLIADCTDDQGTRFAVFEQPDATGGGRPSADGHLAYVTLEVVDSARARAFYAAVLGWQVTPGRVEDGWQVEGTVPMIGLSGGHQEAAAVPMWRVPDIDRAVAAVRAHGGTATDPARQPYGVTSECTDDQGMRFYLGQL